MKSCCEMTVCTVLTRFERSLLHLFFCFFFVVLFGRQNRWTLSLSGRLPLANKYSFCCSLIDASNEKKKSIKCTLVIVTSCLCTSIAKRCSFMNIIETFLNYFACQSVASLWGRTSPLGWHHAGSDTLMSQHFCGWILYTGETITWTAERGGRGDDDVKKSLRFEDDD